MLARPGCLLLKSREDGPLCRASINNMGGTIRTTLYRGSQHVTGKISL